MKVLIIGSGGREHALAWKLSQSPKVDTVYCAPGNGGTQTLGSTLSFALDDFASLADFAIKESIDLTVVGPEDPLVGGIVDFFKERGLTIFGPTRDAARMEGSKTFCREICQAAGVPVAQGQTFTDCSLALQALEKFSFPMVVKADGLAAGKGVTIAFDKDSAIQAVREAMEDKRFGAAGDQVVLEEYLKGYEVSILAICSGEDTVLLDPIQDHKPIYEGDTGPNTGGMGTYSPVPLFSAKQKEWVKEKGVLPILKTMKDKGCPFQGVLFVGLMVIDEWDIRVLECNVRFGDPETQAILPRLKGDLFELLNAAAKGESLSDVALDCDPRACVTVVAASSGYPGSYEKGKAITGLEAAEEAGGIVFHAGTSNVSEGLVTSGGRVLAVSALADDLQAAQEKSYAALAKINFEGMYYRKDIGYRAIAHLKPGVES
jgi:phosphoribosylamine--glycine ligase